MDSLQISTVHATFVYIYIPLSPNKYLWVAVRNVMEINLSLILIYFVVWLNSAQKQMFADKFSWLSASPVKFGAYVRIQQVLNFSRDKTLVVYL